MVHIISINMGNCCDVFPRRNGNSEKAKIPQAATPRRLIFCDTDFFSFFFFEQSSHRVKLFSLIALSFDSFKSNKGLLFELNSLSDKSKPNLPITNKKNILIAGNAIVNIRENNIRDSNI